jgi:hypothetical protein
MLMPGRGIKERVRLFEARLTLCTATVVALTTTPSLPCGRRGMNRPEAALHTAGVFSFVERKNITMRG